MKPTLVFSMSHDKNIGDKKMLKSLSLFCLKSFCRLFFLTALLLAPLVALQAADTTKPRPNIILFLIDDLGWKDLGCQGSTFYQTPNIDRLATEGVRFTEAYAACAVCSPTRAAILTGKYPARLHFTHILGGEKALPNRKLKTADWIQNLPLEEVTFAEALKAAGYATGHFGKWHVGGPDFGPDKQGFDVTMDATPAKNHQDKNVTQLTDAAIAFMRAHAKDPFLAHICHHTVHVPYEADEALTATNRARAPATGQNHPKMAAMIETLDQSVRRVLQTLDELGLAENTARVRTDRALEKLRRALAARGVTSTASALGLALGAHAVSAAPASVAASTLA
ncbi:MAG: sulfatase-like hydrolase/transferase, partial [Fimbriimonadaceae bacterium]